MFRLRNNTRFIWLPIPLLLAAMAVLWAEDLHTAHESPLLLLSLNFLCMTLTSVLVVILVGKSFIRSGAPGLLMLGCGVIFWAVAASFGAAALGHGINATVTVHNTLAWLAAICHLSGVVLFQKPDRTMRMPGLALALAYAGTLCLAWLVDVLTMAGMTPLFFVQGHGGTPVRQFMLGSAIIMFGFTAAELWRTNRPSPSAFIQWYAAALLLVATGLLGVMIQTVFGGALSWTGRSAQYLGGIYMLMAAIAAVRESGMEGLSLSAALRESQQNYRALVDLSPDAIAVHTDGKYVFVNPAAVRLFGAAGPEDLIGREVLSLIHPEDREVVAARMSLSLADGRTAMDRQLRILRMDGRPVDVESAGARIEFQGRPSVQVVLRDITEIKRINIALRESEQRFRLALKNAPVTVAAQNKDLRVIWAYNQRTIEPENALGKTDSELFAPEDVPRLLALKRQVMETGRELSEKLWITSNGRRIFLDLYIEPLRNADGEIAGVWLATLDMTQMKLAEEALRASEDRYWSLFSGMTEGFALHEIITDGQGRPSDYRFLDVNPAFERLTGLRRGDVIGRTHNEVLPGDDPKWLRLYGAVALTGEPIQFDNYSPALQRHYEVLAYRPAPDQFAVIFMDITERKLAEEQLKASLAEKELLIKEIHHRVKNNLQIISSLISLQADNLADAQLQGVLSDVRDRVKTMALVHEKLYQTEDLALLDFAEYAPSLLNYLWSAHGAATGKVRLNMSFAPLILPVEMAVHCGLILNELGSNAIKHAFPGGSGGEVTVTLEHDPATGAVCLRVRDNGIGLPENLDWRQSSSLGLRLVQMLARQMRGTVQTGTCPDPGPGTEFQIRFNIKGIPA